MSHFYPLNYTKSLINNPTLRKEMGQKASVTAKMRFDAAKCADELLCLFKRLVDVKSAPFRSPVPIDSGHPFRSIPVTHSGLIPVAF